MSPPTTPDPHPADLLSALLDDELDDATAESVGRHVRDCVACREELTLIEWGRHVLRGLPAVDPPVDFVTGLVSRRQRATRRGAVLSMAAAVVAVVASVAFADPVGRSDTSDATAEDSSGPTVPPRDDSGPAERPYGIWRSGEAKESDPSLVDRAEEAAQGLLEFFVG